jgi:hypothetical protein
VFSLYRSCSRSLANISHDSSPQQNNDEAKGGKEFVLMAGFPPKDLFASLEETVDTCNLAGEAISVRWKD